MDQVVLREGRVSVRLRFGFPVGGYADALTEALRPHIEAVAGGLSVDLELTAQIHAHAVQRPLKPLAGVKNIIAVASAKAGSANQRLPSIWRWPGRPRAPAWACWMRISMAPASR